MGGVETPPTVKFDRKGRLICPQCSATMNINPDYWVTRGIGRCPAGHNFVVTDKVCTAVNEILAKNEVNKDRKEMLKNFGESPGFSESHDDFKKNQE